jgi:hypothetical protein
MKLILSKDGSTSEDALAIFRDEPDLESLAFLRRNTIATITSTLIPEEGHSAISDKTVKELRYLWKQILVDAICFLRINDTREAAFYLDKAKNKSDMKTEGIDDVATLNVYGIDELTAYFEQFAEFESTLYGADKYYRDHIVHPLNVWITGLNILNDCGSEFVLRVVDKTSSVKNGQHFDEKWLEKNKDILYVSTAELSAMWAIVALTHDLGYPLEKVEKVNDQLDKMLAKFGRIKFFRSKFSFELQHDHLIRFLLFFISSVAIPLEGKNVGEQEINELKNGDKDKQRWITHRRVKYHNKFARSWEEFDHGMVSSLILLKTLTFFIESDLATDCIKLLNYEDARQFSIRAEILHSIASHTTPKIYHLTANNLAFLLVLCDDMQEWSRPTLSQMKSGGMLGNAKKVEIDVKLTLKGSKMHCKIAYDPLNDFDKQYQIAKRIFDRWYERLRPALGDIERTIDFSWSIKFGNYSSWTLDMKSGDNLFNRPRINGPDKENPRASTLHGEMLKKDA